MQNKRKRVLRSRREGKHKTAKSATNKEKNRWILSAQSPNTQTGIPKKTDSIKNTIAQKTERRHSKREKEKTRIEELSERLGKRTKKSIEFHDAMGRAQKKNRERQAETKEGEGNPGATRVNDEQAKKLGKRLLSASTGQVGK